MKVRVAAVLTLLLGIFLSGCGILGRGPKNQFYDLETIAPAAKVPGSGGTPVGIDALELPPGYDRKEMLVRGADNKLEVRGTHQWAGPLEDMVIHTLAFDLADRLPEGAVVLPGQSKPGSMRSLSVVLEEMAPGPNNEFILDARWTLGTETRHERITVPMQSLESAQIARALSEALAQLADRMAARL
jgi:uncharacterized lipoprotein YmbA